MILKKLGDEYKLYSHDSCIATTHESPYKKLSLKNCQAIENGYDLDELAVLSTKEESTIVGNQKMAIGFIKGFQKAIEILGDKKFSEDDMIEFAMNMLSQYQFGNTNVHNRDILRESLPQQTEWDVEIEIECGEVKQCECSSNENCLNPQPKLDEDGCLILRRC